MNRLLKLLIFTLVFVSTGLELLATHNRAGEISYVHDPLPGQKYRYFFTVTTYTKTSSMDADRDSLDVNWGDMSSSRLPRVNNFGNGEDIGNDIKKNIYTGHHAYSGFFPFFVVSMTDPNRVDNILNINFGMSENISFVLRDTLFLLPDEFFGFNSSPVLVQPPIDIANRGYPFIHNPNAFDPDGDELRFSLIPPIHETQGNTFADVPNFVNPNLVTPDQGSLPPSGDLPPGPDYGLTIDSVSGEIVWDRPWQVGIYNIAILIEEFRSGFLIGTMVRDMQIEVKEADNAPPDLVSLQDTCVLVGDELSINIVSTDPDNNPMTLTATGFPFVEDLTENVANFEQTVDDPGFAQGVFSWSPGCQEVFSTPYSVVFKTEDVSSLPLVDLETWFIQVVAPPPTGLTSSIVNGRINLAWDDDYECSSSDKFLGYSIWRKVGCDSLVFDNCSQDISSAGYELVEQQISGNTYEDFGATPGLTYSYRITADFTDVSTSGGVPLNFGHSLPSNNTCETLPSDVPIITNVDVETTSATDGSILVRWTKPDGAELDTMINTGPYVYELYRIENGGETLVQSFTQPTFELAEDTVFVDTGLNTAEIEYFYFVRFVSNSNVIGDSDTAGSVFLNLTPGDGLIELIWNEQVPWINNTYDIYKQDSNGSFEIIGTTEENFYVDQGLTNGQEYCYFIESDGSYFTEGILDPLINKSQQNCAVAIDTIPPCNPDLLITNDCDSDDDIWSFQNRLTWSASVSCVEEAVAFNVYFRASGETEFVLVGTTENSSTFQFTHDLENTIAGCYFVTSFDVFGNESSGSNEVCVENCVEYELPNAFTPNGDGANEMFTPLLGYRFVSKIDMRIYNRWGGLVYETEDPDINWAGVDSNTGEELPSGVYFYVGRTVESFSGFDATGIEFEGYVHLIRTE